MKADELWILHGTDPVLWNIPIYATAINEKEIFIDSAVPLMSVHRLAMERVLEPVAKRESQWWRTTRTALKTVADPGKLGSDPEALFSWEKPRLSSKAIHKPQKRVERDSFLGDFYLANRMPGAPIEVIEFWFRQFCDHMLFYLLNRQRPVDLYFATLHCSGYRANWKEVILGRYPWIGQLLTRGSGETRKQHAILSGVQAELMSLDLLAIDGAKGFMHKRIEVEHKHSWWRNMMKVERDRLRELGSAKYARKFLDTLRGGLDRALSIYAGWLTTLRVPSAAAIEGGYHGEYRLGPNLPKSVGARHRQRARDPIPVVVPNAAPEYVEGGDPEDLYQTYEGLQALRAIRQAAKNLRNGGAIFYPPSKREIGETWVPLLSPAQEHAARELLGVADDRRQKGMAGPAQQPVSNGA